MGSNIVQIVRGTPFWLPSLKRVKKFFSLLGRFLATTLYYYLIKLLVNMLNIKKTFQILEYNVF